MFTQSEQSQCLSDLVLCEVTVSELEKKSEMVNSSELSPNVNSLDLAIKIRAENLTKNSLFSAIIHEMGHQHLL